MPLLRTILAVLIGFSLAMTPVAAAMATPMSAMVHCDKKGIGSNDNGTAAAADMPDCCCDKSDNCSADACALKCFKTQCALSETSKAFSFLRQPYVQSISDLIVQRDWPPPAPPPRV